MEQKGIARLVGVAVAGAVIGGVFVYFVMGPAGDISATRDKGISVPGQASGSATGTGTAGSVARPAAGDAKTQTSARKKPGEDKRVILSEDPEHIRETLTPGPVDAIPWDPNEPNEFASLSKADLYKKIQEQANRMNEIGRGRVECMQKITELKKLNDGKNPEIIAAQKEYDAKYATFTEALSKVPGVAEHMNRHNEVKAEMDTLSKRRDDMAKEMKKLTAAAQSSVDGQPTAEVKKQIEDLAVRGKEIDKRIQEDMDGMIQAVHEANNLRSEAREKNPAIKAMHMACLEKQHQFEAKRSAAPDVLEWRKKLAEYDKQYEAAAQTNVKLHKALMVPVATGGGATAPRGS